MAQALLFVTLLSIAGTVATAIHGFQVSSGPSTGTHILLALISVVLALFSQSMTMFFFIGTGKEIKEKAKGAADEAGVIARTKTFKAQVFPSALYSMLILMATFIMGGGVHRGVLDHETASRGWILYLWVHRGMSLLSIGMLVRAWWVEVRAMEENNRLMERFLRE